MHEDEDILHSFHLGFQTLPQRVNREGFALNLRTKAAVDLVDLADQSTMDQWEAECFEEVDLQ